MAVDRGGLQYTIAIRDEFTSGVESFRTKIRQARSELKSFQRDAQRARRGQGAGGDPVREEFRRRQQFIRGTRQIEQRAAREKARDQAQELRRIQGIARERERLERETARIRRAQRQEEQQREREQQRALRDRVAQQNRAERERQRLDAARIRDEKARERQRQRDLRQRQAVDPEFQAQRRINQELLRERTIRAQIGQLRSQARQQFAGGDILGGRATIQRARELEGSLKRSAREANGIFFTFRRLVGVLAVFTLARQGVAAFNALVASGVQFNDRIEQAEIGIGGLVATLGDVRNEFGESVGSAEELERAIGLSRVQIAALRQDSLRTTATFQELLETFQVAVGPGFAAGLGLDEIRQLTVQISQAATALGVPQNQLAEEIRSLLSGTIQARTTRIATALGITNEDIRQLREAGTLFETLNSQLQGFSDAAERQARSTVSGISTLIRGAAQELLGQAGQPLFDELLAQGNEFFDQVLTIRDEAGNIRPNPEAVAAFRSLFQTLADGLASARELGRSVGFDGLERLVQLLSAGLRVAIEGSFGAARTLLAVLEGGLATVEALNSLFGITAADLGSIAALVGTIAAGFFVWRGAIAPILPLIGLVRAGLAGIGAQLGLNTRLAAIFNATMRRGLLVFLRLGVLIAAIPVALQQVINAATGLELSFTETLTVIQLTVREILGTITRQASITFKGIANDLLGIFTDPIAVLAGQFANLLGLIAGSAAALASVGIISEEARVGVEDALAGLERLANQRSEDRPFALFSEEELARERAGLKDFLDQSQREFDQFQANRQQREDIEAGILPDLSGVALPEAGAELEGFSSVVSTADKDISALASSLEQLNAQLTQAEAAFGVASRGAGQVGGLAGQVTRPFEQAALGDAQRLQAIRATLAQTEERLAELRAQGLEQTGEFLSLERDRVDLTNSIVLAQERSAQLAALQAATVALNRGPELERELVLTREKLAAERAVTAAQAQRLPRQQAALVQAENAVNLARTELELAQQRNDAELFALQSAADRATGEQRDVLVDLLETQRQRFSVEQSLTREKLRQLELERQEADLVANGSFEDGVSRGLENFAQNFSSQFEAGAQIAVQTTQQLASFISSSIVDAFDPTKDGTIRERFGRFLQQIASQILQTIIQLNIARALLQNTGAPAAGPAGIGGFLGGVFGGFSTGGHLGGMVSTLNANDGHAKFVRGFNRGGVARRVHPLDTVPAMLQPGEFVMRKSAVDAFGTGFFSALNTGNLGGAAPAVAAAAAPAAAGMQRGGIVSSFLPTGTEASESGSGGGVMVLPVQVASESNADALFSGGKQAFLDNLRDNADEARAILDN